jgi:serine protease Do
LDTAEVVAAEVDLALQEQQALQAAVQSVAESVVQIRTVGGLDRVGRTFIAQGPTTGLVVSADGYIVSSAFNFAQQPTSILVQLPSGEQAPARLVARDKNRMLVLLKVDTDQPLPVPPATPTDEIRVGQWAVAVGRTFRADRVAVSVGIVSALNRMYGRVIQTDASVSVANYGGPLVDLQGRVLGILVPMSPQSAGGEGSELAGAEFYDSGIGFAVPWEHVLGILERWQQGDDLLPGKLGVGLNRDGALFKPPEITTVWQGSPAAEAGWQPKDVIVAVDGQPVETQSQLRFLLMPRYAGDRLRVTIRRGEETIDSQMTLTGELAPFRHAFLGVLPMRDAPDEDAPGEDAPEEDAPDEDAPGVTLRSVWPQGPAARAGLQRGDRILKIGDSHLGNLDEAFEALSGLAADSSVEVVVERDKKERTLSAKLSTLPEEILSRDYLPQASSGPQEDDDQPAELKPLKLLEFVQIAQYYSPPQDESRPLGLLLWLAQGSAEEDQELADAWRADCRRDGLLLVIAHPQGEAGWSADEMEFLKTLLRTVRSRFEIDSQRSVVCGRGKAGQLAFALAFRRSNGLSGVIGIDAPLPRTFRLPANLPGHRLALLSIESKNSSFAPLIRKDIDRLREAGYPTSWLQRPNTDGAGRELEQQTRGSMARWIDGLDRF